MVFDLGNRVEPKPCHVERHREFVWDEPGFAAYDRCAAVTGDGEIRPQFTGAVGGLVANTGEGVAVAEQSGDLGPHPQGEAWFFLTCFGQQVEQIPLRHKCKEGCGWRRRRKSATMTLLPPMSNSAFSTSLWGRALNRGKSPRSSSRVRVTGWTVSPRKSRKKSACFSNTVTSITGAGQQQAQDHAGGATSDDRARGRFGRSSSIHPFCCVATALTKLSVNTSHTVSMSGRCDHPVLSATGRMNRWIIIGAMSC